MTATNATLNIQTLENLCVVDADFDIWSGKARLEESDFKLGDGGEIPPENLTSLGSKKICDPAAISRFHALKSQARRLLTHYGLRFMNGFAIPQSKLEYIESELEIIQQKFNAERQLFLDNYEETVENWLAENPNYADELRRGIMPVDVVSERIGFKYLIYNINPANDTQATQMSRQVDSLTNDLYKEIASEASDFYKKYLSGTKPYLSASTKPSLVKLFDKVDGLSFMNASLDPLAKLLKETIDGFDTHKVKNRIEGPFLYQVCAVVLICADEDKIHGYADGSVKVENVYSGAGLDDDDDLPETVAQDLLPLSVDTEETEVAVAPEMDSEEPVEEVTPAVEEDAQEESPETDVAPSAEPTSDTVEPGLSLDLLGDMEDFFAEFITDDAPAKAETPAAVEPVVEPAQDASPQVIAESVQEEEPSSEVSQTEPEPVSPEPEVNNAVSAASPAEQPLAAMLSEMGAMPMEFDMASLDDAELPVFDDEDDW
tara:strand:- start:7952 stop:9415 length:1464 start_codon:yes stop_codon:yes gene_type:complete